MSFQIIGTGRAHPEFVLSNDMLSEIVDTDNQWIVSRTGIKNRYVSTDETITDLSVEASKKALRNAGLTGKDLDLIICSTMKADYACPSLACLLQREIDARCPAMDLNAACTGFIYAMDVADGYMSAGKAETILIVGAEMMTRHLDWSDRSTCVLFGDGAGAAVLRKGSGLRSIKITAKGDDQLLVIGNTFCPSPYGRQEDIDPHFKMQGAGVFRFAVTSLLRDVKDVMKMANIHVEDIKMLIPHQANLRVFQAARDKLGFKDEQLAMGIDHYGNTSSASIPLMLDELIEEGKIGKGDLIVMSAFGGGLTTGACLIEL